MFCENLKQKNNLSQKFEPALKLSQKRNFGNKKYPTRIEGSQHEIPSTSAEAKRDFLRH